MKAAVRLLLVLVLLAVALAPMAMHFVVWAPALVRAGHNRVAVASIVGAVAWFALWVQALPPVRVRS